MSLFRPKLYSSPLPGQMPWPLPRGFDPLANTQREWWGYRTIQRPAIGVGRSVDWASQVEAMTGKTGRGRSSGADSNTAVARQGQRAVMAGPGYGFLLEAMIAKKAYTGLGAKLFWLAILGGVVLYATTAKKRRRKARR